VMPDPLWPSRSMLLVVAEYQIQITIRL
jgi:hypothetical protein